MNILPIAKLAAGAVASIGVGTVIGNVIKTTTPPALNLATRIGTAVGAVVLTTALGDITASYVGARITDTVAAAKAVKDSFKKPTETPE